MLYDVFVDDNDMGFPSSALMNRNHNSSIIYAASGCSYETLSSSDESAFTWPPAGASGASADDIIIMIINE